MAEEKRNRREFDFDMEWVEHMGFIVKWDFYESPDLFMDEPPSMGGSGKGPNAARMIVAGVANCLSASLTFCLGKSRANVEAMRIRCHGVLERNERGRLRLVHIAIQPLVELPEEDIPKLERCLGIFEDFCIVTEAVRQGIPVDVQIFRVDGEGNETPMESPE
ncbi:MAG: OsmC family protein [Thermoplasmata archaeon]|nr:MAG: OsmC family protein [Thermoplasmata archaeon]